MSERLSQRAIVKIDGEEYDLDSSELEIDRDDIDLGLAEQAAKYAWFSVASAKLMGEVKRAEAILESKEADVEADVREYHRVNSEKKPTEKAIQLEVERHEDVRLLVDNVIEKRQYHGILSAFASAYAQRKDALVTLARNRNFEMTMPSATEVERIKENITGGHR